MVFRANNSDLAASPKFNLGNTSSIKQTDAGLLEFSLAFKEYKNLRVQRFCVFSSLNSPKNWTEFEGSQLQSATLHKFTKFINYMHFNFCNVSSLFWCNLYTHLYSSAHNTALKPYLQNVMVIHSRLMNSTIFG